MSDAFFKQFASVRLKLQGKNYWRQFRAMPATPQLLAVGRKLKNSNNKKSLKSSKNV
jgi:hypothetical protein